MIFHNKELFAVQFIEIDKAKKLQNATINIPKTYDNIVKKLVTIVFFLGS